MKAIKLFAGELWAIHPAKFEAILTFLELRAEGKDTTPIKAAARKELKQQKDMIAVVNVFGTISRRMNLMSDFSGGTSTEELSNTITSLVDDSSVGAILLNVDSPGGGVYGIQEIAKEISEANKKKPIYALADSMAASAAYWISSAVGPEHFYAAPSADIGSIGVIAVHYDESKALEQQGYKATVVKAGQYKGEFISDTPLNADALGELQRRVDETYKVFVDDVARYRKVPVADVRGAKFGEGRVLSAKQAADNGMIDGVATMPEVLKIINRDMKARAERQARLASMKAQYSLTPK